MNTHIIDLPGRTKHNLAYLCFLPPVLLSTFSGLSKLIQLNTGTAGGVGFLVLIPMALLALICIPVGIVLSLKFLKDYGLVALVIITILYVMEIITEAGSVPFYNAMLSLYGVIGMVVVASWFLFRRKTYYPVH